MKNINVTAGLKARSFSGLNKITTNGNSVTWIPQEEAGQYVKTETLRATKNGTYTPPQGVYYDRVIVKVRKKDRKAVSGDTPETVTPEATKVSVNVSKVRTGMSFPNVEKITTPGTNGETVTWVQENQAYVYAKTESLSATENDTYEPSEGAFFKQVTVNVTGEQEDDLDDGGTGTEDPGTGEVIKAYSSVTVNVPGGEGIIEKSIKEDSWWFVVSEETAKDREEICKKNNYYYEHDKQNKWIRELKGTGAFDYYDYSCKGYSKVTVDIQKKFKDVKNIISNGIYEASVEDADGYLSFIVDVPPIKETGHINIHGYNMPYFTEGIIEYATRYLIQSGQVYKHKYYSNRIRGFIDEGTLPSGDTIYVRGFWGDEKHEFSTTSQYKNDIIYKD